MNNKAICYVIGACNENCRNININKGKNDLIIAADGGFDILLQNNINPDILLGDFDSISDVPNFTEMIKFPSQKDETDTLIACRLAIEKGYKNLIILGGVGGRIDHTIANIRVLDEIANNEGRGFLVGDGSVMTVIKNDSIGFSPEYKGYISIFANNDSAEGISLRGLKYNVKEINLTHDSSIGVSNEFVGERADITVQNGNLLVIWYEKEDSFFKNMYNFFK